VKISESVVKIVSYEQGKWLYTLCNQKVNDGRYSDSILHCRSQRTVRSKAGT
jgi:hypothetical protein